MNGFEGDRESVVLCEGYHDRAFWSGWLLRLGCTDPGRTRGEARRAPVLDPWGKRVNGGQFGFRSRTGSFIRVLPCRGTGASIRREANKRLDVECRRLQKGASHSQLSRLVVSIDSDTDSQEASPRTGLRAQDLHALVRQFDPGATEAGDGDILMFNGAVVVSLVRWEANKSSVAGVPSQQTLERLVCAALVAAHPDRAPAVQEWLDSRPDAPDAGPKEFAWSHMAGWYADQGCEAFFRVLWEKEPEVVAQLESRLRDCGAWRVAEALAQ